jgi:hypothetical protein
MLGSSQVRAKRVDLRCRIDVFVELLPRLVCRHLPACRRAAGRVATRQTDVRRRQCRRRAEWGPEDLMARRTHPAASRPARHESFIVIPFLFSPLRAEIPGLLSSAAFLRRPPHGICHRPARRASTAHRQRLQTRQPQAGLRDRRHKIGANPAPNAIRIRVYSHFGPIATSGKSPTGSWHSRKRGWLGASGVGQSGPGRNS